MSKQILQESFVGNTMKVRSMDGAISLLRDDHKLSGGIYTPSMLGEKYINRLESANVKFETKVFEN
ncbi:hypothetical protein BofuT4_uP126860.1 [Botrytis cinerea T4]|uniref:Uncharacterized protein n=1 Tax=Botryotinia fuckeliana (strain T4) TaxID=999810 RepID=G2YSP0_BOTF4|nr:hypothetical protein BofuT4_uP126860.1 [Botrytis cinerea T4]